MAPTRYLLAIDWCEKYHNLNSFIIIAMLQRVSEAYSEPSMLVFGAFAERFSKMKINVFSNQIHEFSVRIQRFLEIFEEKSLILFWKD